MDLKITWAWLRSLSHDWRSGEIGSYLERTSASRKERKKENFFDLGMVAF